jgi:mono/diheme cytochrome c family protein
VVTSNRGSRTEGSRPRPSGRGSRVAGRATAAVAAIIVVLTSGCSWFTDFKQQPKIDPWESANDSTPPRGNPQLSVPVYGSAAPGFMYGRVSTLALLDSMSRIPNPVAADTRSLENGRKQFQINCAPCHGRSGNGMGPTVRYGYVPMPLNSGTALGRSDGYIFGMIRNGRGLMPPYNRIEEPDRWDVVNYVRTLQGRGAAAPDTSHGRPGETGLLVPGASISAPTRPAPYYNFIYPQAGAPPTGVVPNTGIAPATSTSAPPTGAAGRAAPDTVTDTTKKVPQP